MLLYTKTDEAVYPDHEYKMSGNTIAVRMLDLDKYFCGDKEATGWYCGKVSLWRNKILSLLELLLMHEEKIILIVSGLFFESKDKIGGCV